VEQASLPEWGTYGPTAQIFSNMELDHIFGPMGRNYGIGHRDEFLEHPSTSLYKGYVILATSGSIAMIPSTGNTSTTALGIASLTTNGSADDELALQLGNALDAGPFKISAGDLGFECRLSVSAITADKWSWFVGLALGGTAGAAITDKLFADSTGAVYGTTSLIGFQKLYAETSAVDGMFQLTGQTKQDGATKPKLDTLHTLVASTYVKLGFRYRAATSTLHWFVDGVEAKGAMVTAAEIAAATFPDTAFLTPTIGLKDVAGDAAITINLDWWMTAQAF
jgi:hypothetical protein